MSDTESCESSEELSQDHLEWEGGAAEDPVVVPEESSEDESSEEDDAPSDILQSERASITNEVIVVNPENRMTGNVMTRFEMTEHNNIRAAQIAASNNCMIDVTGLDNAHDMAKRELMMRKSPLTLCRHVGQVVNKLTGKTEDYFEYWSPNEMTFSATYPQVM